MQQSESNKILWCTIDRSYRTARHFDDFRNAVSSIIEVHTLEHKLPVMPGIFESKNMVMPTVVTEQLEKDDYDFIVCDAIFAFYNEPWSDIDIPKYVIIEDQHNPGPQKQIDFIRGKDFTIFHRYEFNDTHQEYMDDENCIWFPHSVNTNIFKDYGLEKEYGVLSVGVINDRVYKHRYRAHKALKSEYFYKRWKRPCDTADDKWPIREDYAREINKARLTISGGSIFNYPVMKYFEIPACRSVLFSNWFDELGELGFEPDLNMLVMEDDIPQQVREILKNEEKMNDISQRGLELIIERHSNEVRAEEFVKMIDLMIRFWKK